MKTRLILTVLCALFFVISPSVVSVGPTSAAAKTVSQDFKTESGTATTVVLGSENPLIDVPAVQSAVDQGGKVLLRGTFDFGTDAGNHIIVPGRSYPEQDTKGKSTVFIYRADVTIVGETGPHGELLTVIKNGMPAFWIGWDGEALRIAPSGTPNVDFGRENFPQDALGRVAYRDGLQDPGYAGAQTRYARASANVSVMIESIYFDSPKHYGIKATAGRNVFVLGNAFRNVQFGGLVHGNNVFKASHIAAGFLGVGLLYAPFVFPAITGSLVVERNVVDDVGTEAINTHAGESIGLGAVGTGAVVTIERNEIRNVGRQANGIGSGALATSILLIDNISSSPLVSHNIIDNSSRNGIWDFLVFAPSPGPTISHNSVVNCPVGILISGTLGPRKGELIHQNSISQDGLMGSGVSCISAYRLSDSLIRGNDFKGDYAGPLVVMSSSADNTLLENRDLRSETLGSATYSLDAASSGNLIRGLGTAIDNGTNNTVLLSRLGIR